MTTENNVAAQAGDEPIKAAFEKIDQVSRWIDKFPVPTTGATAMMCLLRDVKELIAVSPRATADVERDAKRQAEQVERLVRAAKVYAFNYLQDEHEEAELCTCGPKQHAELVELFAALAAIATTKPGA